MADISSNSLSPILHLSADLWSYLPLFLGSGDLIRLASTGYPLLASRIGRHSHDLKLSWNLSRFMDFEEVFATVRRLNHVRSVDFQSASIELLSWTPIGMCGWPSSLVSLCVNFLGSLDLFMGSGDLQAFLPNLEVLDVSEELYRFNSGTALVNLKGLPLGLRSLRLSAPNRRHLLVSQLASLPSQLEELHLRFLCHFCPEVETRSLEKATLPSLPSSITSLVLEHSYKSFWHIDWSTLPRSLRTLELCSEAMICVGDFESHHKMTTIELHPGSLAATPNLTSFLCDKSTIRLEDVCDLIPPSVTHFTAHLIEDLELGLKLEDIARFIAPRLGNLHSGECGAFDEIVLGGKISFPKLKTIIAASQISKDAVFPGSLTDYQERVPPNCDYSPLPATLLSLVVHTVSIPQLDLLTHLTSLDASVAAFPLDAVPHLPNTLTELEIVADPDTIASALFDRMLMPGQLASLSALDIYSEVRVSCLSRVPPQLTKLHIRLLQDSLLEPIDAAILHSLRSSRLHESSFYVGGKFTSRLDGLVQLLNNLPYSLRVLVCGAPCPVSRNWNLSLPSKLLEVTFYQTETGVSSETPDYASPPTFVLPQNLRLLSIDTPGWTANELPPHLSLLSSNYPNHVQYKALMASKAPRGGLVLSDSPAHAKTL